MLLPCFLLLAAARHTRTPPSVQQARGHFPRATERMGLVERRLTVNSGAQTHGGEVGDGGGGGGGGVSGWAELKHPFCWKCHRQQSSGGSEGSEGRRECEQSAPVQRSAEAIKGRS